MNKTQKIIAMATLALCFAVGNTLSAKGLNLPVQTIGSIDFYVYHVEAKETIYSISKKLGITIDQMKHYNPELANGLKKGQNLYFPVADFNDEVKAESPRNAAQQPREAVEQPKAAEQPKAEQPKTEQPKAEQPKAEEQPSSIITEKRRTPDLYHKVVKGESLYGISKQNGMTVEEIIALNPEAANGIEPGMMLLIRKGEFVAEPSVTPAVTTTPEATVTPAAPAAPGTIINHTIKKGDTLYNVAKRYNTTIADIEALNPGIAADNFKLDTTIRVRDNRGAGDPTAVTSEPQPATPATPQVNPDDAAGNTEPATEVNDKRSINIALMLPLQLDSKMNKQSRLYTEFYEGFLLAVDNARQSTGKTIRLHTYDTGANGENVDDLLRKPELSGMDAIFAPDATAAVTSIARYGNRRGIAVLNAFAARADNYKSDSTFYQIITPADVMNRKVIEEFTRALDGRQVIFVKQNGETEKDIVADFKLHLVKQGIKYQDFSITRVLTPDELTELTKEGKGYVVMPTSASKKTLTAIIKAVKSVKQENKDARLSLFGYPEWITYTGSHDDLKAADAYIYSRFYADPQSATFRTIELDFKRWYGHKMNDAVPYFAVMGYDCGTYIIDALSQCGSRIGDCKPSGNGVQTDVRFARHADGAGYVNEAVNFISFGSTGINKSTR